MADTGYLLVTIGEDDGSYGGQAWADPGNVTAEDAAVANCTAFATNTHYLKGRNPNPGLSGSDIIDGIEVKIKLANTSGLADVTDDVVKLLIAGAVSGTNKARITLWPGSLTDIVFGDPSDLWGLGPLYGSDVNPSNFGAVIAAQVTSGFSPAAVVDSMKIRIYYHASADADVGTMDNPASAWLAIMRK